MYNVFVFFLFFLTPGTCRSWGTEATIRGIYQHTEATSNRSHGAEWSFSGGIYIQSGRIHISTSLCSSALQRCVILDQCVAFCIIFNHSNNILHWGSFFLIGASPLSICGCWCSSGTWLSSLQTYVQEKSSWGKAWYVKDAFRGIYKWELRFENYGELYRLIFLLSYWGLGNCKRINDIRMYMFYKLALRILYIACFFNQPLQRIACGTVINWFFDSRGLIPHLSSNQT